MTTRKRVVIEAARKRSAPELRLLYVRVEDDPDPDVSYLEQEEFAERLAAYQRGDFTFVGVRVEAEIIISGTVQTLMSPGLWGIESDSGEEYIEEVAVEEYGELRKILTDIGVPTAQLPQANGETVRSMEWRT